MSARATTWCEACRGPLNHRAAGETCARCISAGAAFSRAWADDLMSTGQTAKQIAAIVGLSPKTVHARHRERRGPR